MDEAKTLVHMSISAMLSAMLIAAAVGLIGLGYNMWSYFSRQDYANARMADYSNYTAFDNTTVRGQEVIELIESDLDVFVVILDASTDTNSHSIDNTSIHGVIAKYVPDVAECKDYKFGDITDDMVNNSIPTCANALRYLKNRGSTTPGTLSVGAGYNLSGMSYSSLMGMFTGRENLNLLEKPAVDNSGTPIRTNSYAAFKSTLVYANDGTTDVVGVVLVRECAYCTCD